MRVLKFDTAGGWRGRLDAVRAAGHVAALGLRGVPMRGSVMLNPHPLGQGPASASQPADCAFDGAIGGTS